MARKFKFVGVDTILAKLYRDLGLEDISETDVIEQIGEALSFMEATNTLEDAVAFIEVKNHRAQLPNNLHYIIQVAKDNKWVGDPEEDICPSNILADKTNSEIRDINSDTPNIGNTSICEDCDNVLSDDYVLLDCNGHFIDGDFNVAYYRPYFDLQYDFVDWRKSHIYTTRFTPVRLANHTFFKSIVCEEDNEIYKSCNNEYSIQDDTLILSFEKGMVAVAYYRQKLDPETGYPMIPDDPSYITAITKYVTMMYFQRMWALGRAGYENRYLKSEQDWQWYCKQAKNKARNLHGIDDFQNFTDMKSQMIPKRNAYYGFFGKMSQPEDRTFLNPNRRKRFY